MTRVIVVASGKGGVGKTTLTSNLGAALTEFGVKTIVVDANLTTPNLGFHLGVPLYPKTLHDVLKGEASIDETIYAHPSGLKVIPAGISMADLKSTNPKNLGKAVLDLIGDYDVVILDGAAGLGKESLASLQAADEALIVTNPQLPAVTDALKTIKLAEEAGTKISGIVLNRVRGSKAELSNPDVESLLGYPVIATVGEEGKMLDALAAKTPLVSYEPNVSAAHEIKKLAAVLVGHNYEVPKAQKTASFWGKIFGFIGK